MQRVVELYERRYLEQGLQISTVFWNWNDLTIMLIKSLEQRPHAIIPQLHTTIVKRGKNPGTLWMERNALDSIALWLELGFYQPGSQPRSMDVPLWAYSWWMYFDALKGKGGVFRDAFETTLINFWRAGDPARNQCRDRLLLYFCWIAVLAVYVRLVVE